MNAHPDTDVSGDLARDGELGTPNFQTLKDAEKAFSMLRAQMRQVVAHFQNPERAKDSTPAETEAETEAEAETETEAEAEVEDEDDDDALVHSLTEISMKPEAKILKATIPGGHVCLDVRKFKIMMAVVNDTIRSYRPSSLCTTWDNFLTYSEHVKDGSTYVFAEFRGLYHKVVVYCVSISNKLIHGRTPEPHFNFSIMSNEEDAAASGQKFTVKNYARLILVISLVQLMDARYCMEQDLDNLPPSPQLDKLKLLKKVRLQPEALAEMQKDRAFVQNVEKCLTRVKCCTECVLGSRTALRYLLYAATDAVGCNGDSVYVVVSGKRMDHTRNVAEDVCIHESVPYNLSTTLVATAIDPYLPEDKPLHGFHILNAIRTNRLDLNSTPPNSKNAVKLSAGKSSGKAVEKRSSPASGVKSNARVKSRRLSYAADEEEEEDRQG
jgi:hypothetical protein